MRRKKEEEERKEEEKRRLAAEEAERIASTQLPVQLDLPLDEAGGLQEGLTFVNSVSVHVCLLVCLFAIAVLLPLLPRPHPPPLSLPVQVSVPVLRIAGVPGGGASDVAQVDFLSTSSLFSS